MAEEEEKELGSDIPFITKVTKDEAPEIMQNIAMDKVDGKLYPFFILNRSYTQAFEVLRELDVDESDVFTVGFPRTGNHWAFEVVNMVINQSTEYEKSCLYSHMVDFLGANTDEIVKYWKSPRNLCMHASIKRLPVRALEKKCKVVYLLRNPKDVLVSMYKLFSTLKLDAHRFKGTWCEFFDIYMEGNGLWGYWWEHLRDLETFIADHPNHPVFVRNYENAVLNPIDEIRRLSEFFEKPLGLVQEIVDAGKMENMKVGVSGKVEKLQKMFSQKGTPGVIDSGFIGNWRKVFTVAQSESFNKLFDEETKDLKFAKLIRKYMD